MRRSPLLACAVALCVVVGGSGGCSPDLAVRRVDPAPVPASGSAALSVLETPSSVSPVRPDEPEARRNAAARLLDLYGPSLLAAGDHTLRLRDAAGRPVSLELRRGAGPGGIDPGRFESLEPTDHFVVKTRLPIDRTPGAGVPLVGNLRPILPVNVVGPVRPEPVKGITWAVTALPVVRPAHGQQPAIVALEIYDPHEAASLAADYTTPEAVVYARIGPQRRGWRDFLGMRQEDFSSAGIYAAEKPTPDKTPLVLVHGLISDPSDFHTLHNALEGDPAFRRRYQVWFFYYPSSLPVPYSAMQLREDLEAFIHRLDPNGTHPALHRAVLVGHSMGGLLCRLAVSDGGDRYYGHFFRQPLDRLHVTAGDRALLRRAFYYRACPDVAQVIFIATPHRGSRLAGGLLGTFGRLLVRVPLAVSARISRITSGNRAALVSDASIKPASSITSLSPHDPVIEALADMPVRPGVGLHSILGNRGRGGPPDRSSDGVVPYASSHLPQAESETIVPAGHTGTLARPETTAELVRILHQTSKQKGKSKKGRSQHGTEKDNFPGAKHPPIFLARRTGASLMRAAETSHPKRD